MLFEKLFELITFWFSFYTHVLLIKKWKLYFQKLYEILTIFQIYQPLHWIGINAVLWYTIISFVWKPTYVYIIYYSNLSDTENEKYLYIVEDSVQP